jgi:hypothetical protein
MWLLTENPWPVVISLSVVAVGLLVAWNTRRDHRLLGVALAVILLAGGAWELERRIVTERERLELQVLDLRDAVQDKEVLEVQGFFSNSELILKGQVAAALALVSFEDQIRITAIETTVTSEDTRGETRFRANASLSVVGFGSVGHQPTLWSLSWRKEEDEWRIVKVRRFHPLSHKELPPLSRTN